MADDDDRYDYGHVRAGIAIILAVVVAALVLIDAASPTFAVDSIQLGLLLGTLALLLGVEGARSIINRP